MSVLKSIVDRLLGSGPISGTVSRWLSALGGRRFILSGGAGVATSFLSWHDKISGEIYRDVILGTVGLYIAGNTFQKVKQTDAAQNVEVARVSGADDCSPPTAGAVTGEATDGD